MLLRRGHCRLLPLLLLLLVGSTLRDHLAISEEKRSGTAAAVPALVAQVGKAEFESATTGRDGQLQRVVRGAIGCLAEERVARDVPQGMCAEVIL